MPHHEYTKRADAHISEQTMTDCRALVTAVVPGDLPMFEEMIKNKIYGGLQQWLGRVVELSTTGDYPDVTHAQQTSAKRLLGQLQFTGEWKQRG